MKKTSFILLMLAMFGLTVACDGNRGDNEIEREEMTEEIGHEADEFGDDLEDTTEEVVD